MYQSNQWCDRLLKSIIWLYILQPAYSIAKLNANGFDQEAWKIIHSYLIDHKKIGSSSSKELDILCCVPQGSILGPLLSNIDILICFLSMRSDIANYADDTSPNECALYILW